MLIFCFFAQLQQRNSILWFIYNFVERRFWPFLVYAFFFSAFILCVCVYVYNLHCFIYGFLFWEKHEFVSFLRLLFLHPRTTLATYCYHVVFIISTNIQFSVWIFLSRFFFATFFLCTVFVSSFVLVSFQLYSMKVLQKKTEQRKCDTHTHENMVTVNKSIP